MCAHTPPSTHACTRTCAHTCTSTDRKGPRVWERSESGVGAPQTFWGNPKGGTTWQKRNSMFFLQAGLETVHGCLFL